MARQRRGAEGTVPDSKAPPEAALAAHGSGAAPLLPPRNIDRYATARAARS